MKKAQIQTDRQESLSEISDKQIKIVLKWTEPKIKRRMNLYVSQMLYSSEKNILNELLGMDI
jgi:hypothetical protein